jgi:SpoVK/Ycf46/Vps4 family AAA+-type ATPase
MIKPTQVEDSFTGGVVNVKAKKAEEPLCYDSEDEDLIETNKSPKNFLLLGKPCSGKSVLAKRIAEHFRVINLNVQDVLNSELQMASEFGKRVCYI